MHPAVLAPAAPSVKYTQCMRRLFGGYAERPSISLAVPFLFSPRHTINKHTHYVSLLPLCERAATATAHRGRESKSISAAGRSLERRGDAELMFSCGVTAAAAETLHHRRNKSHICIDWLLRGQLEFFSAFHTNLHFSINFCTQCPRWKKHI